MSKQSSIIRVRHGINGFKYSACDAGGNFIGNFAKLSDVRKHWLKEIKHGKVVLVRELNQIPNMTAIESAIKTIESVLKAYKR